MIGKFSKIETVSPWSFTSIPVAECYGIKEVPSHDVMQQVFPSNTFHGIRYCTYIFKMCFLWSFQEKHFQLLACYEEEQQAIFLGLQLPRLVVSGTILGAAEVVSAPIEKHFSCNCFKYCGGEGLNLGTGGSRCSLPFFKKRGGWVKGGKSPHQEAPCQHTYPYEQGRARWKNGGKKPPQGNNLRLVRELIKHLFK